MNPSVEIIAELAQGYEGNPEWARLLLRAAASAGADAAKYQLVYADELATPDYQHYPLFRTLEMPDRIWSQLREDAKELGIAFHFDIFGSRSLALAAELRVDAIKLHGTDIANDGLLAQVSRSPIDRVLLGAGGAHLSEIESAVAVLAEKQIVIILGFQAYPTPTEANQIARVAWLASLFSSRKGSVQVGFADHTDPDGVLAAALPAAALGAGARVLEKHLTLAKRMKLEDYESALNPDEFAAFVEVLRKCALAIGGSSDTNDFGMSNAETLYRKMIRRHVVAAHEVSAGASLLPGDVELKRTAAIEPITDIKSVYGRTLLRKVEASQPIIASDLREGPLK